MGEDRALHGPDHGGRPLNDMKTVDNVAIVNRFPFFLQASVPFSYAVGPFLHKVLYGKTA